MSALCLPALHTWTGDFFPHILSMCCQIRWAPVNSTPRFLNRDLSLVCVTWVHSQICRQVGPLWFKLNCKHFQDDGWHFSLVPITTATKHRSGFKRCSYLPRPGALSWGACWVDMSAWDDKLWGDNCSCFIRGNGPVVQVEERKTVGQ